MIKARLFKEYLYQYRWFFVGLCALALITYGSGMFSFTLNIDEERSWLFGSYQEFMQLYIRDGRFGQALLAFFTLSTAAFPFWTDILTTIFLLLFCALAGYLFWAKKMEPFYFAALSFALFLTFPIHSHILAFSFMAPSVVLCYSFCLLAALLVSPGFWGNDAGKHRNVKLVCAVLLLTLVTGTYQSMLLCFVLMVLLLNLDAVEKQAPFRQLLFIAAKALLVLLGACAVYWGVNAVLANFYETRSLTDQRLLWGTAPVLPVLQELARGIWGYLNGKAVYGGAATGISLLLAMAAGLARAVKQRRIDLFFFVPFLMLAICFGMNIALGSVTPARTMQALPLLLVGFWVYAGMALRAFKTKWLRAGAVLLCVGLCFYQVYSANRLAYTSVHRYEAEKNLVYRLAERIDETVQDRVWNKPVVFIGHYPIPADGKPMIGADTISATAFNWDAPESQLRKRWYFMFLGYPYPEATEEMVGDAKARSAQLPSWPHKDSVREFEEYILVKLGEA